MTRFPVTRFAGSGLSSAGYVTVAANVKADGITDDTAAVVAAIAALGGPGRVILPRGVIVVQGNQVALDTGQWLVGQGQQATTLLLKASSTGDVVRAANFAALTGTNSTATPYRFGLRDLTVDGNKANAAGGTGVSLYGYAWWLSSVRITNCATTGLYTEWSNASNPGVGAMEGSVDGLRVENCNSYGIYHLGPHDSHWHNIIVTGCGIPAGQPGTTVGAGTGAIHLPQNNYANGTVFEQTHVWGNYFDYAMYVNSSGITLTPTVQLESGRVAQLRYDTGTQRCYAKLFTNNVSPATVKGLVFGGAGFPGNIKGEILVEDCGGGAVDFNNGGANHDLTIRAKYTGTPQPATVFPGLGSTQRLQSRIVAFVTNQATVTQDDRHPSAVTQVRPAVAAAGEYLVHPHTSTGTSSSLVLGTVYYAPVDVGPGQQTFRGLGTNINAAAVGGTTPLVHLGLYTDDGTGTKPFFGANPLGEVTLDPTTTTGDRAVDFATDLTLAPGRYWLAWMVTSGAAFTTPPTVVVLNGLLFALSRADLSNTAYKCWTQAASASAATLPAVGSVTRATLLPIVGLRAR